jgi:hypothetical protein
MLNYLKVGLVVVLACSIVSCRKIETEIDNKLQTRSANMLGIVGVCIRELVDSMEDYPDMYISVFETTDSRQRIELSSRFFKIVDRERVFLLLNDDEITIGVSTLVVYFNRMEYIEDGEFSFTIFEHSSLSQKYLHEFAVKTAKGQAIAVELISTLEI